MDLTSYQSHFSRTYSPLQNWCPNNDKMDIPSKMQLAAFFAELIFVNANIGTTIRWREARERHRQRQTKKQSFYQLFSIETIFKSCICTSHGKDDVA